MTITGTVEQLALTHNVSVTMAKDELEPKLAKYWEDVKDTLPENVIKAAKKGGFRKITRDRVVQVSGGKSKFFAPVLLDVVDEYLSTQERQALAYTTVEMVDRGVGVNINSLVFLEPEVKWKKKLGIDEPLNVKVFKEPLDLVEQLVERDLQKKQQDSVILAPLPDETEVTLNHVVVLDCTSFIINSDGTKTAWKAGTFSHNKWDVNSSIKAPELQAGLIGMKKDENKTLSFVLNSSFDGDAGKTVEAIVKVLQVYRKETPEVNDDLAKTNGYDNIVTYRQALGLGIKKRLIESRQKLRNMQILSALANPESIDIEPVPAAWMQQKALELWNEGRAYTNSDDELVQKFAGATCMNGDQVTDANSLLRFLAEKQAQELVEDIVLRSWGKMKGVPGDTTLKNMAKYVELVRDELNKIAVIEEVAVSEAPLPTT